MLTNVTHNDIHPYTFALFPHFFLAYVVNFLLHKILLRILNGLKGQGYIRPYSFCRRNSEEFTQTTKSICKKIGIVDTTKNRQT